MDSSHIELHVGILRQRIETYSHHLLQMIVYQIQYKLLPIITTKTEIIINYIYSLYSQSLLKVFSVIPHFTWVLKNLQMIHGLLFHFSRGGFFYMQHPTNRITHTTAFITPVVTGSIEYNWIGLDCFTEVIGLSLISPQADCVTTGTM